MRERPRLGLRHLRITNEPDISDVYKAAVEGALRWAWKRVREQWPEVVTGGREEDITECMWRVLNEQGLDHRRLAPGMDSFETVSRGGKVSSVDGRNEKAPDLVFRPIVAPGVRNRGDWGVFIECKIIGKESNHSPRRYCEDGVARFARGEYAPYMPSATMLAYVRDGQLPHTALSSLLDSTYATQAHEAGATVDTSKSRHGRGALPQQCIDITLTHLWLDACAQEQLNQRRGRPTTRRDAGGRAVTDPKSEAVDRRIVGRAHVQKIASAA